MLNANPVNLTPVAPLDTTTVEHAHLNEKLSELGREKSNVRTQLEYNEDEIEASRLALIDDIKRRSQAKC